MLAINEMELNDAITSKSRLLIERMHLHNPDLGLDIFRLVRLYPDFDFLAHRSDWGTTFLSLSEDARVETLRLSVIRRHNIGPHGK